jgi:hypothetical protein
MTEFLANPMSPVLVAFLVVMVGFCIVAMFSDNSPTPEYVRIMAEHNARMAAHKADEPMRIAHYILEREERQEAMRKDWAERSAKRHAEYLASKGE